MDKRKENVLRAIIQEYIEKAEPISSGAIAEKYDLNVSSATVRNDMAMLEKMGLIEQPHTSAGRIPSEKGYRYYVDYLMEKYRLLEEEQRMIRATMEERISEVEELLNRASSLLSEIATYPVLVSEPCFHYPKYKNIKLIKLEEKKGLLVVLTSEGRVKNFLVNTTAELDDRDCQKISNLLTQKLGNKAIGDLAESELIATGSENAINKDIMQDILFVLRDTADKSNTGNIHISGTLNIFNQPEFKDLDKVRELLVFFEKQKALKGLVNPHQEGITIKIGGEVDLEELDGLSVITSTYSVGGQVIGAIGMIGPTRMAYSRSATLLEKVAGNLSDSLLKIIG